MTPPHARAPSPVSGASLFPRAFLFPRASLFPRAFARPRRLPVPTRPTGNHSVSPLLSRRTDIKVIPGVIMVAG
jgi:hypothetical protein